VTGRRRALRAGLAAALLWLFPGGAVGAAEMLSFDTVTCAGLTVTGTGLPGGMPLVLAVSERTSGPVVRSVPARTSADGTVRAALRVSLAGFGEVSVAVLGPGGDTLVIGNHQFATPCPAARTTDALATTGPTTHQLGLLLAGIGLLGLGLVVGARTAYRGTHSRGTHARGAHARGSHSRGAHTGP
jgi:hypothetical protein